MINKMEFPPHPSNIAPFLTGEWGQSANGGALTPLPQPYWCGGYGCCGIETGQVGDVGETVKEVKSGR